MSTLNVTILETRGFTGKKDHQCVVSLGEAGYRSQPIPKSTATFPWNQHFQFDLNQETKAFRLDLEELSQDGKETKLQIVSSISIPFNILFNDLTRGGLESSEEWYGFVPLLQSEEEQTIGDFKVLFSFSNSKQKSTGMNPRATKVAPGSPSRAALPMNSPGRATSFDKDKSEGSNDTPTLSEEIEKMNLNPMMKKILADMQEKGPKSTKIQFETESATTKDSSISGRTSGTTTPSGRSMSRSQSSYSISNSEAHIELFPNAKIEPIVYHERKTAVEALIRAAWSLDAHQVFDSLEQLSSAVTDENARVAFLEVNGVQMLAVYLTAYGSKLKNKETLLRIVWILASFSSEPGMDSEVIKPIISLLTPHQDTEILLQCIWALSNWSIRENGPKEIKQLGGLKPLLKLLYSTFEKVFTENREKPDQGLEVLLLNLIKVFINLSADDEMKENLTSDDELVTLLMVSHLNNCEKMEIALHMLWLLSNITTTSAGQASLFKSGGVNAITKIIASFVPNTVQTIQKLILQAVSCLANLSPFEPINSVDEDVIPALTKIISTSSPLTAVAMWDLKGEAARALAGLSKHKKFRTAMVEVNAVASIASQLNQFEDIWDSKGLIKTKRLGLWALANLSHQPKAIAQMDRCGLINSLKYILFGSADKLTNPKFSKNLVKLQNSVLWLLVVLSESDSQRRAMREIPLFLDRIVQLFFKDDEKLNIPAAKILSILASKESMTEILEPIFEENKKIHQAH
eukprot:TRINITY_DN2513_c0_g1_i1.p1 TRINITY_DN2513_c0_g1~~TRINITY_DN2513_c0_g1_i1.p1  ORF type:complete len:746 (+),score=237.75 TRINITY_DN2513_c0_g1_i1:94-2331(+)